jgi:GLPGLI family protein
VYRIAEPKIQGSTVGLDQNSKQLIKQVKAYAKNISYTLITTQDESFFEQDDILRKESDSPLERIISEMALSFASFNERIYSNRKDDTIVFVKKLVNQEFIVKRKSFDFSWSIKDENKKILGFEANKALGSYFDPVTNKDLKVEAWFIPSIALQAGPDIFAGLPGLIAEVHLKGAVVTIDKIDTNLKNLDIEKVDDSNAMLQEEYEALIKRLNKKFIKN